jgi:hypothetical protein
MKKITNESDAFYRYLYQVFQPELLRTWKVADSDEMSGSISLNVNGVYKGFKFTYVYATPCWEGDLNFITLQFGNEDYGSFEQLEKIEFPFDGWTMDVVSDVKRYKNTMTSFLIGKLKVKM